MNIIEGENIYKFRLLAIRSALKLETKGLRGRFKASVIARDILTKAGIKAKKNKDELLVQFQTYIDNMES
jgi:hypothetical protein